MSNPQFKVLIFPGGSEIGLEIRSALRCCKEVSLFSAALPASNHAPFVFKNHFTIPSIHADGWLDSLNEVLSSEQIQFIIPAFDDIALALLRNADSILARVVTSPLDTWDICRSKKATYRAVSRIVDTPVTFARVEDVANLPVFVKPDKGQGSKGARKIDSWDELSLFSGSIDEFALCEYLPGREFTVDCFSDRDKGLLFCRARERLRTKNGICMHSRISDEIDAESLAEAIAGVLEFHGAWFFQLKESIDGIPKLMEVGPRIAGTMALNRVYGVNFPLLSLYENVRVPVKIAVNDCEIEIDRALQNRYRHNIEYRNVYVDLDDTILIHGKVNLVLVTFLFQAVNEGKRITLLTRHSGDIDHTLEEHRLSGLFDEVVLLDSGSEKFDYIVENSSIFIDDSFSERESVSEKKGIPCFDCSMVEALLNHQV